MTSLILVTPTVAKADDCVAYSSNDTVCSSTVPAHTLDEGDPADKYKGFRFSTENYAFDNAIFDDKWTTVDGSSFIGTVYSPTATGAQVKLPNVGTWTDPQGDTHGITATLTFFDANGGGITSYSGKFGITAGNTPTGRSGIGLNVEFTYTDGSALPDTFAGLTGFADLDTKEGAELLSGFDGAWLRADSHLQRYGDNGWQGTDENDGQTDLTSLHAQQHVVTAAFSGSSFTFRYSKPYGGWYAMVFASPLLADAVVYTVTMTAVDTDGNTLSESTVSDKLHAGGTWNATPPTIDGYEYVGLADDSAPLSGSITSQNERITLIYRRVQQETTLPSTGYDRHTLLPLAGAGIIFAALSAMLAIRRRRHCGTQ